MAAPARLRGLAVKMPRTKLLLVLAALLPLALASSGGHGGAHAGGNVTEHEEEVNCIVCLP